MNQVPLKRIIQSSFIALIFSESNQFDQTWRRHLALAIDYSSAAGTDTNTIDAITSTNTGLLIDTRLARADWNQSRM